MSVFTRYAEVLRPPGLRSALLASLVGRLSLGMTGLALLLVIEDGTGSYAAAGVVSACYAVALALVSPTRARTADRTGPSPVLRRCGVLQPLAYALVLLLAELDAHVAALAAAAALVGATVPPLGGVMRALWGEVLGEDLRAAAFSLESVVIELCFVLGPLLVAVLAVVDPAAGLVASGAVATAGALALAAHPLVRRVVPHPERQHSLAGPLASGQVRALLATVLFLGASFGTIEVGVLAFVEEQGSSRAAAGAVLAVWSIGSMLGGLVYGGLHVTTAAARQAPLLAALIATGTCLPVLAPGVVVLGLLLALSGTTIAPFSANNSVLLSMAAPVGTVTEAFAWGGSMIFGGAAAGTAVAGVLVEAAGARAAFVATAGCGVLIAVSHVVGRRVVRLVSEPAVPPPTTAHC